MLTNDEALLQGEIFRFSGQVNVLQSANTNIGFKTGNRAVRVTSAVFEIVGGITYAAEFVVYEATTYTGGAAATVGNRNRNFKTKSPLSVITDIKTAVTPGALGAVIAYRKLVATNQNNFQIGDTPDLILEPDTSYVLQMKNLDSTAAADFFYSVYFKGE